MIRISSLACLFACLGAVSAQTPSSPAPASPFRVGVIAEAASPCSASTGIAGADALSTHLSKRLERPVEICRYQSTLDAAAALSAGAADMVSLDPDAIGAAGPKARSLLTPRAPGSIGRILSVAVVKADAPYGALSDLHGLRFAFAGANPAHFAGPKAALQDNGLPADAATSETVAETPEEAFALMQFGGADVMVLHASAWQRLCRGEKPTDKPCAGLKEIFRGRERPKTAFGVRTDLSDETLHRLVGVLIALHLENHAAFDWLAPGAVELTPTEAGALSIGRVGP